MDYVIAFWLFRINEALMNFQSADLQQNLLHILHNPYRAVKKERKKHTKKAGMNIN